MHPLHAVTFDFYDDRGVTLKQYVPDPADIPGFVKTASAPADEAPANSYAVVMLSEGKSFPRFPIHDAGNTWLSSLYFHDRHGDLPPEAEKVAAAHIYRACNHFGIEPVAALVACLPDAMPESNIVKLSSTAPAPLPAEDAEDIEYAITLEDGRQFYPLGDAAAVKEACQYFEMNQARFHPRIRREFAVKVASVAARFAQPVTEGIELYSGEKFAPSLEGHLFARYAHLYDEGNREAQQVLQKVAAQRRGTTPAQFAELLTEFDERYGLDQLWDRGVADPWFSTIGFMSKEAANGSTLQAGAETVTSTELEQLAAGGFAVISENFGEAFAKAFCKKPIEQFRALPLPQKQYIARLASSFSDAR